MELFTKAQFEQLIANGRNRDQDHPPVVKLFTPDAQCTWLVSEIDPDENDLAFGLCDLGMGYPELGYIDLIEIRAARGQLGLRVERDFSFTGKYPMSIYAEAARQAEHIVENDSTLQQVVAGLAARKAS